MKQRRGAQPQQGSATGRGAVGRGTPLDAVDRGIIEVLQADGRASFRSTAARLGVSEATVRARFGRLCDADVLQVVGVTNPLGLGFEVTALMGVTTSGDPGDVADQIAQWREATYVVVVTGQFDVLAEFVCTDWQHYLAVTKRVRGVPGVLSTQSFVYLALVKQLFDWGAPPAVKPTTMPEVP